MDENLVNALRDFLQDTFRERRMCPRCVRFLPDHEPDCKLGRLERAYRGEKLPPLMIIPPAASQTKTGKARKTKTKTTEKEIDPMAMAYATEET